MEGPESISAAYLSPAVQHRLKHQGQEGRRWLETLPSLLAELCQRWELELGQALEGGSEALVTTARRGGREVVLKLGIPGSALRTEARALRLAEGRAYAQCYEYDPGRKALLLEKLGARLSDSGLDTGGQLEATCRVYREAWRALSDGRGLTTGQRKAHWLGLFIQKHWSRLGRPCAESTVERALEFAARRREAHRASACVLVHGDGHGNNTLLSEAGYYKLIDPDGLFAEHRCSIKPPDQLHSAPF